jgi:hypothetical protein
MKTFAMQAALVAALIGTGTTAFAADSGAMSSSSMTSAATVATMICRPAASGEKPTATSADSMPLVCKKVDMPAMMAMKAKLEAMPGGEPLWLQMFQEFHIDQR